MCMPVAVVFLKSVRFACINQKLNCRHINILIHVLLINRFFNGIDNFYHNFSVISFAIFLFFFFFFFIIKIISALLNQKYYSYIIIFKRSFLLLFFFFCL